MPSVLVVDDDPAIRTMLARAVASIADVFLSVDQAANGVEALRQLGARKYDLVLLDVHMAGLDGRQVLRIVASKDGLNRDTPFCVLTADGSEVTRAEALANRAMMFVTKPVHIGKLIALITPVLKRAARLGAPTPLEEMVTDTRATQSPPSRTVKR
jgi:DNA-binding response OmpR family regulator